jgi:hypothetical protein
VPSEHYPAVSIGLGSMLFQKEAADLAELREIVLGIATELAGATPEPASPHCHCMNDAAR